MVIYSYKMTRDYGFAPNPFWGLCTLANCKPKIRKKANVGDWIIGTGAKTGKIEYHLIFLMKVTEILDFQQYWEDPRFQCKKPVLNGSLVQMHGDNIYYETSGTWFQMDSHHSFPEAKTNKKNLKQDIRGKFVLVSNYFFYFGDNHFEIPDKFKKICCKFRDVCKIKINESNIEFIKWISENFDKGILADPINWKEYNQKTLPFDNE